MKIYIYIYIYIYILYLHIHIFIYIIILYIHIYIMQGLFASSGPLGRIMFLFLTVDFANHRGSHWDIYTILAVILLVAAIPVIIMKKQITAIIE
jgi:hypothetical protein